MLKPLHKSDTQTAPFVVTKDWNLSNTFNDWVVLTEHSGGLPVALEYEEYLPTTASLNSSCNIALEQQDGDHLLFRRGKKATGLFYPDSEEINVDGTYKRMVYSQVQNMFYNRFRDPTKVWGLEYLDFENSQTKRFLSDGFDLYDVPVMVFGEKIIENSVVIYNRVLDNNYQIVDDGKGNLIALANLFSKQQELGNFSNEFVAGINSDCSPYFGIPTSSHVVTPADYPLIMWLRSTDLPNINNSVIGTGSAIWYSTDLLHSASKFSADANSVMPLFVTNSIGNIPAIQFDGINDRLQIGPSLPLHGDGAKSFTVAIVYKSAPKDSILLGNNTSNIQIRRLRSNTNNISVYGGDFGPVVSDQWSSNFSSSISQSVVLWYVQSNTLDSIPSMSFYENMYYRSQTTPAFGWQFEHTNFNTLGATSVGGYTSGSIAEICIWSCSFNSDEVTNMFTNYFYPRYSQSFLIL